MIKNYIFLIYLIFLDIITTTLCILFGGVEYNPISMYVMDKSYILFIIFKLTIALLFYFLGKNTDIFNDIFGKFIIKISIIIFIIIVSLNTFYLIVKISGGI